VLENDLRLPLGSRLGNSFRLILTDLYAKGSADQLSRFEALEEIGVDTSEAREKYEGRIKPVDPDTGLQSGYDDWEEKTVNGLLAFFADRLKVHLREKGARHDLIDAVFSLGGQDDLALIVKRVEALSEFLKTDDGAVLLTGVRRATNILRDEEKKDKKSYAGAADPALLREREEKALHAAIQKVKADTAAAINVENFAGAMRALAELRAPVDAFFDKVTVNAPDAAVRANRLALLSEIRAATLNVADFSKIAG